MPFGRGRVYNPAPTFVRISFDATALRGPLANGLYRFVGLFEPVLTVHAGAFVYVGLGDVGAAS